MSRRACPHTVYLRDLVAQMWHYHGHLGHGTWFDRTTSSRDRPPVYIRAERHRNVLVKPGDSRLAYGVKAALPARKRHRFFGSMKSSQALAQSVFGNLEALGRLDVLTGLKDRGLEVFETGLPNFALERRVTWLGEDPQRSTEMDVSMWGPEYTVAVECKLAEPGVGHCSRATRRKLGEKGYCDGRYALQPGHSDPCPLTAQGIAYWTYVPQLFHWPDAASIQECPLKLTYQLVRNVLAACVRGGKARPDYGHAVLVYDARNPRFAAGGRGDVAYQTVVSKLKDPHRLRRVTWQQIAHRLWGDPDLRWLGEALSEKYGV